MKDMTELWSDVPQRPDPRPRRPRYGSRSRRRLHPKQAAVACESHPFAVGTEGTDLLRRELLLRHSERGGGGEKDEREDPMNVPPPNLAFFPGRSWQTFPSRFV